MNEERWETADQIQGALDRFVADVPGYRMPAVYAVGMVDDTGVAAFPHVNRGDHPLPAAVLANVVGDRSGTRAHPLSPDELDRAIALLAPAEACRLVQHPNLWAWREMRTRGGPDAAYVAIFVGDAELG